MIREELAERLDQEIEAIRAGADPSASPELRLLLEVAAAFETLPDPEFRRRLKAGLLEHARSAQLPGKFETPQGLVATDPIGVDRTVRRSAHAFRPEEQGNLGPAMQGWGRSGDRASVPAAEIAGVLSMPFW